MKIQKCSQTFSFVHKRKSVSLYVVIKMHAICLKILVIDYKDPGRICKLAVNIRIIMLYLNEVNTVIISAISFYVFYVFYVTEWLSDQPPCRPHTEQLLPLAVHPGR